MLKEPDLKQGQLGDVGSNAEGKTKGCVTKFDYVLQHIHGRLLCNMSDVPYLPHTRCNQS